METNESNSPRPGLMPPPRVRVILTPRRPFEELVRFLPLIGLAGLLIAAISLAVSATVAGGFAVLAAAVGGCIAVQFFASRRSVTPLSRRHRLDRLEKILQRPDAAARLPHRAMERLLLTKHRWTRVSPEVPSLLQAPSVVVLNVRNARWLRAAPQRFEPIDLGADADALAGLLAENLKFDENVWDSRQPKERPGLLHFGRGGAGHALQFLNAIYVFVICLVPGVVALVRGRMKWEAAATLLILGGVALAVLAPALRTPRHFLVPGGLVVLKRGRWGRREVSHLRAAECRVLIDAGSKTVPTQIRIIGPNDSVSLRLSSGAAVGGFLAGWLSTAPPPTEQQLRAFAGEKR
jgi:hypothetical protein